MPNMLWTTTVIACSLILSHTVTLRHPPAMLLVRVPLALAIGLQCLEQAAGACPAGAKAFPASKQNAGKIDFAGLFEIDYYSSYKVIKYMNRAYVDNQWGHAEESLRGQSVPPLVLYQCGSSRPALSAPGITADARFFEIPLQKATIGWGAPVPFFELLSVTEAIHLIDLTYVAPPCTQLMEYCTPGIHLSANKENETWVAKASESQAVFTDTWGTGYAYDPEKDVPFEISFDPGSLHRAEWIKFVAAFFNEEDLAEQLFGEIKTDYDALAALATQLKSDVRTQWRGVQPKVLWVRAPASISNAHYQREFTWSAGGQLVAMPAQALPGCTRTTNTDGSLTIACNKSDPAGLSNFRDLLSQADIIIDQHANFPSYDAAALPNFETVYGVTASGIPALEANPRRVFTLDRLVTDGEGAEGAKGLPWLGLAQSQPQVFLAGLMEAIWDINFESPCHFTYLRRKTSPEHQTTLGHDECPLYSSDNNHDCAGLHTHQHTVQKCAPSASIVWKTLPTTPSPFEVNAAFGARVWLAAATAIFAAF